jgi:hypothetical protein
MSDGFLGRWSRRKLETKQGRTVEAQPPVPEASLPDSSGAPLKPATSVAVATSAVEDPMPGAGVTAEPAEQPEAVPPPTLEDVAALTSESDFSRFAASDVTPDVRNAAMKKLFADPRYNIMDGLDVYIDDYSKPDPIPMAFMRQLASAKFLGLFQEEERAEEEAAQRARDEARDVADNPTDESVAHSDPVTAVSEAPNHADPDLRLQQDHAAPGEDPGRGTG